jgi:hypothetical protein
MSEPARPGFSSKQHDIDKYSPLHVGSADMKLYRIAHCRED